MGKISYYGVTVEFNRTVAAGASDSFPTKIDTQGLFTAQSMQGTLWTPAVVLTSTLAGTPYPATGSSSPGTTGNTLPTLALFRIQITVNSVPWFSSPVRCNMLFGADGGSPHFFQTTHKISATSDIVVSLYNDCASTFGVQGQLLLEGYKEIS